MRQDQARPRTQTQQAAFVEAERRPLMPDLTPTRRAALLGGVAVAGFALAAQPVAASTIVTDAEGLDAGDVTIQTASGPIPGYRARPAGQADLPVVLVVQEIFGLHEHIKDVVRRFAKAGFYAIAPSMHHRQGDATGIASIQEIIETVVSKVPDAQVMADLDRTVAFAMAEGADTARLGVTGFCWGGRITWMYSAHNPNVKAGVAWYGRLVGQDRPETPTHPIDVAGRLNGPVLGLYGGQDRGIPLDTVAQMEAALAAGGDTASTFVIYEDAPHAFHADYRPSYREAAAADGFARAVAWFEARL